MKRFYGNLMSVLTVVMSLTLFASCDDDLYQARVLSGEWSGDFGMYYEMRNPKTGQWYSFDAYETNLVFYPYDEYSASGTGRQVDYYRDGPYTYQYYEFEWDVRNGVIYLHYPYDPELNVSIRDYRMNNRSFSGWIGNVRFELYKLRDFYWNDYYGSGGYGYGWYDGWYWNDGYYYSKTRGAEQVEAVDVESLEIRRGNRFANGTSKEEE
jgi:hypothetical protein